MHGKGGMHAGETATEVGGTYPTGMHSSWDGYPYPDWDPRPCPAMFINRKLLHTFYCVCMFC